MFNEYSPRRVRMNPVDAMQPPEVDRSAEALVGLVVVAFAAWAWWTLIDWDKRTPEETGENVE